MADARIFWDAEIAHPQHVSWLQNELIHQYANTLIGGGVPIWPIDWFDLWLKGHKFKRALSIGCGGGALERDLVVRGLVATVDAFDGSVASLHSAHTAAKAAGLTDRIHYFAADFNEPSLPRRRYDLVLFHQSLHHVAKLEKVLRAVLYCLVTDGLLYLDEYIGPSRFEWSDERLAPHRAVYKNLPESVRRTPELALPIQADDPSEAFRSNEIEPQLAIGFDVVARRPYGGTLLSVLYPSLRPEAITPPLVNRLISEEQSILQDGSASYYAVIVARPKRGVMRLYAMIHYYFVPKFKRIIREVRARTMRRDDTRVPRQHPETTQRS